MVFERGLESVASSPLERQGPALCTLHTFSSTDALAAMNFPLQVVPTKRREEKVGKRFPSHAMELVARFKSDIDSFFVIVQVIFGHDLHSVHDFVFDDCRARTAQLAPDWTMIGNAAMPSKVVGGDERM